MGLFDRLFGRPPRGPRYGSDQYGSDRYGSGQHGSARYGQQPYRPRGAPSGRQEQLPDDQAIARYRYLLRTAPPEQIEQAHTEAFGRLTVDQRQQVLAQLAAAVPSAERPRTDEPETLARVATRAEMRKPGTLERALGGYGPGYGPDQGAGYGGAYAGRPGGPGMGSMIGGSLLGTIGGLVIGTAVADAFFDSGAGDGGLFGGGDEETYAQGFEDGGGYSGGGEFGGGDFGGGDFGGGDFGGF